MDISTPRGPDGAVIDEPRILVIRRDNIGDLVCTTPLITALRARFSRSWIGVLTNALYAPILDGNADVDEVFSYRKVGPGGIRKALVMAERLRTLLTLRRKRIDYALIATPTYRRRAIRLARWIGARSIAGFAGEGDPRRGLDVVLPLARSDISEVEDIFRLGAVFGIEGHPPPLKVVPNPDEVAFAMTAVAATRREGDVMIGLHIGARKPSQRWPEDHYIATMHALAKRRRASFMLFWHSATHGLSREAGDERKARRVLDATKDLNVFPWPTDTFQRLVGGIAACDFMLMADGGTMHIAAALGKPIACLFGMSDPARWRPWGVPYELLQAPSQLVADISVEEVVSACERLMVPPARALGRPGHF